jgi:sn-glycerol 3-phosphate transport system permease protein
MAGGAVADAEAGAGDGACAFAAVAMSAATSAARIGGSRGSFIVAVTTAARRTALDTERYQHRRTRRFTILDGLGGGRCDIVDASRGPRAEPRDSHRTTMRGTGGTMMQTRTWITAWLLLLPAMALLALFTHYPAIANLFHSFYSTPKGARPVVFIGLDNYRNLVEDPIFWQALRNNLIYAVGTIPLSIALALLMAVWVNGRIAGKGFLRLAYFTPTILPMIAVANIWLFFYTPEYGLIEQVSRNLGFPSHNWLGSQSTALLCVMIVAVWKEAGFFMIFYLAALQSMSPNLAEAAAIEGASRWYYFRRVTFPLLMPVTLFVLVNAVINAFRVVDHIVVMTRGGPDNATELLLYYIYEIGFRFWDSAYAAALTMVLLVLLGLAALAQFAFLERRTHYR